MILYPGSIVKIVNRLDLSEITAEISQVIYEDIIIGVSCITKDGVIDFYCKDYYFLPFYEEVF